MFRVIFHPKQLMVISGGDDAEVRVWDLVTKTCMATLKVRRAQISSWSCLCGGACSRHAKYQRCDVYKKERHCAHFPGWAPLEQHALRWLPFCHWSGGR